MSTFEPTPGLPRRPAFLKSEPASDGERSTADNLGVKWPENRGGIDPEDPAPSRYKRRNALIDFVEPSVERSIGLSELIGFIRRRRLSIALFSVMALLIGSLYIYTSPREYTATATVVIDPTKVELFGKGDLSAEGTIATATMETEALILRSIKLAESVVTRLGLSDDPEFMRGRVGLFDKLKAYLSGTITGLFIAAQNPPAENESGPAIEQSSIQPAETDQDRRTRRAALLLTKDLTIQRAGLSYAINVEVVSGRPAYAAAIANAVVDAYLADQEDRQGSAARRVSEWLETRLGELRDQGYGAAAATAEEKSATRAIYDTFLQRYMQAVQQQSFAVSQARVLTAATPPTGPSSPNVLLVLAGSLVIGMVLGLGIGLVRELLNRAVYTREQLERLSQIPCIGMLPVFRSKRRWAGTRRRKRTSGGEDKTFFAGPHYSVSLSAPFSLFSETLRAVKVAADNGVFGKAAKVVGVTSSVANEGKTTVAVNLARLIGNTTSKVLLIDADLRNPALSQGLVSQGAPGLVQMVSDSVPIADVLWTESDSGLSFLPAGVEAKFLNQIEVLTSSRMRFLFNQIRDGYDFVVVDLPPLGPVVDVRAAAQLFDGFIFVVEWGLTTEDMVSDALHHDEIRDKMIGTLLNKVDLSRLRQFDRLSPIRSAGAYLESYPHIS